jgi:hypothetical protein
MQKNQQIIIYFVTLSVLLLSCNKKTNKRAEAENIVTEWIGKEIKFPDNMVLSVYGQDTLPTSDPETAFKILLYSDSTGCTSCKLKLLEWQALIQQVDTTLNGQLSFIFCFYPKDKNEMRYLLMHERFDYPVYVDLHNELYNLNRFPQQAEYQCFLLNKENMVVSIGNPVLNTQVWELYKSLISKESGNAKTDGDNVNPL